jgi:Fe-S cluster assembly iron-binding protein IscA
MRWKAGLSEWGCIGVLTLTHSAVRVIQALTDRYGITSEAGVRLSIDESGTLVANFVHWPDDADQVIEVAGARLFVDADVAGAVEDKFLDATTRHDGEILFALNDQPYPPVGRPVAQPRRGRHRRSRQRF